MMSTCFDTIFDYLVIITTALALNHHRDIV
jgi:hypothetical protein